MSDTLIDYISSFEGRSSVKLNIYETVEQIIQIQEQSPALKCDQYEQCKDIGKSLIQETAVTHGINPHENPNSLRRHLKQTLHTIQTSTPTFDDFVLEDLQGNRVNLNDYFHQDKLVVFAFWASNDVYSLAQISDLNDLALSFYEQVSVVSIARNTPEVIDQHRSQWPSIGQALPVYTVLTDPSEEVYDWMLPQDTGAVPRVVFYSPEGEQMYIRRGSKFFGNNPENKLIIKAEELIETLEL